MVMASIPVIVATAAVCGWVGGSLYEFHSVVSQDGTWYNALQMDEDREDTYLNRVRVTVTERLRVWKSLGVFALGGGVIWLTVFVFVTGIVTLV